MNTTNLEDETTEALPHMRKLCALWEDALRTGKHVPLRARWPELAAALDHLLDNNGDQ